MKAIVAKNQVALGANRCLRLALSGMSYRMFRSAITISILALAVAFLVHMVTFGILSQEARSSAYRELSENRRLGEVITRLATVDTRPAILTALQNRAPRRVEEYRRFAGADADLDAAVATAARLHRVAGFLRDLPVAAQAVLIGDLSPEKLYDRLSDPARFDTFTSQLESLSVTLPGLSLDEFRSLIEDERPRLVELTERIAAGHLRAIEAVQRAYPARTPGELAVDPPADFGEVLRAAGFGFDDADLAALRQFGRDTRDTQLVGQLLLKTDVRAAVSRGTGVSVGDVSFEALTEHVTDDEQAAWLATTLKRADSDLALDGPRVLGLLEHAVRARRLKEAVGEEVPTLHSGPFGMSERNLWLIALSFMVCVVGVANAMLMSVTERFTEIATMKCLGAMDRFVMMMFVFEAIIQGAIGGAIGMLLGVVLAVLRGAVEFGGLLFGAGGALGEVVLGVSTSFAIGVLLAALAAIGPSWIAARLAPMEAMRVE